MLGYGSTYLIVKNYERSIKFYESLLGMKVSTENMKRWAEFHFDGKCIALLNPQYDDNEIKRGVDIESRYSKEYLKFKDLEVKYGNNIVLNFGCDDLRREYDRLKKLNIGKMTEIMSLNTKWPYFFFTVYDPDGNPIEITGGFEEVR